MAKLEIYLNEYNIPMDNTVYFPLASGQLRAYAESIPDIRDNYQFMPFIFIRDNPDHILKQYNNPAVVGFSCSMWNINLSLEVARRVKERFPNCLVVFGGPSVPLDAFSFLCNYPFIDITVRGEGEYTFSEILLTLLKARDFGFINGISWRSSDGVIYRESDRQLEDNLDVFPSPYLSGVYEYLWSTGIKFQAVVETNRGCPFKCSYCFWGHGKKLRLYSLERVREVADWCGRNRIEYVFCADSNFGILRRDLEIARYFVDAKQKYGFPDKFRACYGKNAEETIFQIGDLLHEHDMEKGITLSRQSNDTQTLNNVGRRNIKQSVYNNLQKRYNAKNIPVYTELILGLPGETYHSFISGLETILQSGMRNQIIVYICEVYPNTELADPSYQKRFGIKTIKVPLTEIHGSIRPDNIPKEYNEIVIGTSTMPTEDWMRALVISWIMQLLHGLKLGFHVLDYMVRQHNIKYTSFFEYLVDCRPGRVLGKTIRGFQLWANHISKGGGRGCINRKFGDIYWEPEESAYLDICQVKDEFYRELYQVCREYIGGDDKGLMEVIEYQKQIIPDISDYGDNKTFARQVVIYGRKSNKMVRAMGGIT